MKTIPYIQYSDLLAFCGQDATRPHLMRPWTAVRDGSRRLYATDGRVLVEAHPDDLADGPAGEIWPPAPDPARGFDPASVGAFLVDRLEAVLLDRRPVGLDHPDLPEIETISEPCTSCGGRGRLDCPCPSCQVTEHDCLRCGGAGRFVRHEPAALPIHGQWIASAILERLRLLPRLVFLDARDGHKGIPFAWAEKGRGVVLPMRETADATSYTVRVPVALKEGRAA